jgi:hypothetical protein
MKFHEHLFRVRVVACGLVDRSTDVAKLLDPFLLLFVANAPKGMSVTGCRAIYCQLVRDQKDIGLTMEQETCTSSHRASCWLPNRTDSIVPSVLPFLIQNLERSYCWLARNEGRLEWHSARCHYRGRRAISIIRGF